MGPLGLEGATPPHPLKVHRSRLEGRKRDVHECTELEKDGPSFLCGPGGTSCLLRRGELGVLRKELRAACK